MCIGRLFNSCQSALIYVSHTEGHFFIWNFLPLSLFSPSISFLQWTKQGCPCWFWVSVGVVHFSKRCWHSKLFHILQRHAMGETTRSHGSFHHKRIKRLMCQRYQQQRQYWLRSLCVRQRAWKSWWMLMKLGMVVVYNSKCNGYYYHQHASMMVTSVIDMALWILTRIAPGDRKENKWHWHVEALWFILLVYGVLKGEKREWRQVVVYKPKL